MFIDEPISTTDGKLAYKISSYSVETLKSLSHRQKTRPQIYSKYLEKIIISSMNFLLLLRGTNVNRETGRRMCQSINEGSFCVAENSEQSQRRHHRPLKRIVSPHIFLVQTMQQTSTTIAYAWISVSRRSVAAEHGMTKRRRRIARVMAHDANAGARDIHMTHSRKRCRNGENWRENGTGKVLKKTKCVGIRHIAGTSEIMCKTHHHFDRCLCVYASQFMQTKKEFSLTLPSVNP